MARISQAPDGTVEIVDRPIILGALLIVFALMDVRLAFMAFEERDLGLAAIALIMGAALWYALTRIVRLSRLVLRPDGSAVFSVRDHAGWTHREFETGTLRAGLATDYNEGETRRAILLHDGEDGLERVPFTAYLSSGTQAEAAVTEINAWAARHS